MDHLILNPVASETVLSSHGHIREKKQKNENIECSACTARGYHRLPLKVKWSVTNGTSDQ